MRVAWNQGNPAWWQTGRGAAIMAGLALCAGVMYLFAFNPAASGMYPPCPFHALTGLHCPGCGTLRALHQLSHGHLAVAFCLNPLAVLALPALAYPLFSRTRQLIGGRPLPMVFIAPGWILTLLGVILVYWVVRNIPFYPFSLLAPC